MTDFEEVTAAETLIKLADLPLIWTVNPGPPPVVALEDYTTIKLADHPRALLFPKTIRGVALLVTDWRDGTSPAYVVPDSLLVAVGDALDCASQERRGSL